MAYDIPFDPAAAPFAREVAERFRRGVDSDPYAWAGVGMHTVLGAAATGSLSTDTLWHTLHISPEALWPGEQESVAGRFAQLEAVGHFVAAQLPFEVTNQELFREALWADSLPFYDQELAPRGIRAEEWRHCRAVSKGQERGRAGRLIL